jgi:hypothetical protein
MEKLEYKDGRIYETTTKDITGEFDVTAEIARLTKERDALTAKIQALSCAKIDMDYKVSVIAPIEIKK